MSKLVKLNSNQLNWCLNHARKIVNHYGGEGSSGSGVYNHNKISSNLVGVKSEVALTIWLKDQINDKEVVPYFVDFLGCSGKPDIGVVENFIEVKGLRLHQWDKFKRCIPPKQLDFYIKKNAIVVWTITEGDIVDPNVYLKGWNYAKEVKENGVKIKTICDNIWLKDDSLMHSMDKLLKKL